jgi:hypothetical protein
MKSHLLLLFLLTGFLSISCDNKARNENLPIFDIHIGDSLTSDFKITDNMGKYFDRAVWIHNKQIEIGTIKDHISSIYFNTNSKSEFEIIKQGIENRVDSKPKKYLNDTHFGVEIEGIELYWNDSISGNEYSLFINEQNDSASYSLWIFNERISDSLGRLFIEDYGKERVIEIDEFPEE